MKVKKCVKEKHEIITNWSHNYKNYSSSTSDNTTVVNASLKSLKTRMFLVQPYWAQIMNWLYLVIGSKYEGLIMLEFRLLNNLNYVGAAMLHG